jgi:hypothetical protein
MAVPILVRFASVAGTFTHKAESMNEQLFRLQNLLNDCETLQVTSTEFAYLKIITVLNADCLHFKLYMNQLNNSNSNSESCMNTELTIEMIRAFQMLAFKELRETTEHTHQHDPERASRLCRCMLKLKEFDTKLIEELFFSGLIGSIQIDSIIPCIVRMNKSLATTEIDINKKEETPADETTVVNIDEKPVQQEQENDNIGSMDDEDDDDTKKNELLIDTDSSTKAASDETTELMCTSNMNNTAQQSDETTANLGSRCNSTHSNNSISGGHLLMNEYF